MDLPLWAACLIGLAVGAALAPRALRYRYFRGFFRRTTPDGPMPRWVLPLRIGILVAALILGYLAAS